MSNIIKYRTQGLWNSEYPLVVNRIIDIVGMHKPEELYLKECYEELAAFRPQLAKIEIQERADRDSAILSELDQQRDTLFNIIYTTAKTQQRSPIGKISDQAHSIMRVLKKHGTDIKPANYTAETKRLYDLIADMRSQSEVMDALKMLSLDQSFERLAELNAEFDKTFMQRSKRQAETERVDVRAIRIECDKAITALWNFIDFYCKKYGVEKYRPLLAAINNLNAYYKQQLTARAARRRNKQNIENEEPIALPEE